MKIIYCIPQLYRLGGIERIVSIKMYLLIKKGYDVSVITTDQGNRPFYFKLDNRIKHYDLNINYEQNTANKLIKKFFLLLYKHYIHKRKLESLLLTLKADIVISTFSDEMFILPYIKDGSKKIVEFHFCRNMFKLVKQKGIRHLIDIFKSKKRLQSLKRFDSFVCLSNEDAQNWKELNNVKVIYNISPLKFPSKATLKEHRVISVGRYAYQKGYDRLINAWALIFKEIPEDWTLHIIGEGCLRQELTDQIKKLGLENSVFLDGASNNISKDYLSSSIAVFTSHYEGFQLALVEAESAGIPVVSFDTPCGPKDIIEDGKDGFLVPNGDVPEIAKKIHLLIQDEKLRISMGQNAYENSKRFNEDIIILQWISLFNKVLHN